MTLPLFCLQVAIASFTTYILVNSNNVLDAQKAFVSLSIFNILRRPLAFFPQLITSTMMVSTPIGNHIFR